MPPQVTVSAALPADVDQTWAVLGDAERMARLDPLIEAFEPETGAVEEGTLNRITVRLGPLRRQAISRTVVLDAPHRVVFESVSPARPVRVRVEDTLTPEPGGCRYTVVVTLTPTGLLGRMAAPLMARTYRRTREQVMARLQADLAPR